MSAARVKMIDKKRLKKISGELMFIVIVLGGLIGLLYSLWFVDVHTFDITITPIRPGPF